MVQQIDEVQLDIEPRIPSDHSSPHLSPPPGSSSRAPLLTSNKPYAMQAFDDSILLMLLLLSTMYVIRYVNIVDMHALISTT